MPSMLAARVLTLNWSMAGDVSSRSRITAAACPRGCRAGAATVYDQQIRSIDDLPAGDPGVSWRGVAQYRCRSRGRDGHASAEQPEGVLVRSHTSGTPQVHAIGCPVGTRVRVQRLFSHVPVRLRALKSVAREVQLMQELVAHYAWRIRRSHCICNMRADVCCSPQPLLTCDNAWPLSLVRNWRHRCCQSPGRV